MKKLLIILFLFVSAYSFGQHIIGGDFTIKNALKTSTDSTAFYSGATELMVVKSTGIQFYGNLIKEKYLSKTALDQYGYASTFNGRALDASTLSILSSRWICQAYNDGAGATTGGATVITYNIPADYQIGTDITLDVEWTSASITGSVVLGCGFLSQAAGDIMTDLSTYLAEQTITAPDVAYKLKKTAFTLTPNTTFHPGDIMVIVIYRAADDAADNMSGNLLTFNVMFHYKSNILGQ